MIDFAAISKSYGRQEIFKEVSFRINPGEHVGIVGPNGSGKTTLFEILTGEVAADKGEVTIPKKARLGCLRQHLAVDDSGEKLLDFVCAAEGVLGQLAAAIQNLERRLAAGENTPALLAELGRRQSAFEAQGGYELRNRAAAALSGLGFSPDSFACQLGSFSGGWRMRAGMAKTLLADPDILLLDEPSNYLDTPAVEWLKKRLRNYPGTLLLISHDRFLLNALTDITLEVNAGRVTRYGGNYLYYTRARRERQRRAEAEQKHIDRERGRLERNINRFRAQATKAAQVRSWIKMRDKLGEAELPPDLHFRGAIRIPDPPRSGAETVRLEDAAFSYDGRREIFSHVNLALQRGDKAGIIGYNGMGKTTLLKVLAGRLTPTAGKCVPGHGVVAGYQAQELAEILTPEMTAFDIVRAAAPGATTVQRIREILGAFGFSGEHAEKRCAVLSGGEKIRLCFARLFANPPNFLILDEPTTHLDIAARETLQRAINDFTGTVCLASHDIEFIRGTADRIIELRPGGLRQYPGGYDYYMDRLAAEAEAGPDVQTGKTDRAAPAGDRRKEQRRERARKRQELSRDKKRLEEETARLEKFIAGAEAEKARLTEQWLTPGADFDFAANQKRLAELECDLAAASEQWEKAAGELEDLQARYAAIGAGE